MPSSLAIAAFVLGAVLLLVALLKGGFKIFGAEVSGTAGAGGRIFAFVAGLVLLGVGLSYEQAESSSRPAPEPAQTRLQPAPRVDDEPPQSVQENIVARVSPVVPNRVARINAKWMPAPEESFNVLTTLPDHERAALALGAATGQSDLYVARVSIANTGTVPINVFPGNVHFMLNGFALRTFALDHPMFLRQGTVMPNQALEGLMVYAAPLNANNVLMSYADGSIQVTYHP